MRSHQNGALASHQPMAKNAVDHESETPSALTDRQERLLEHALRERYFQVPRGISTSKLAAEHDMSTQQVQKTLANGLSVVVNQATDDE